MRQGGERCGRSEAASSRGRNEAARGAAKVKRRGAPRGGERCGELAAGRTVRREASGALRAKLRSGTGHAPLPRRPSERPFPAARPNVPSPPPVRTSRPRRASPSRTRRNSPSHSPSISLPPHLSLSLPPLPPLPPRPYGRGGRKKAKSAAPLLAARRLPHGLGGARRLPWDGWLPLGARARASGGGAHGAAKGDKMPLLSRIRAKILRKILQFAPPCVILCMPRNFISKAVRYKRAFLYLFFPCDFIYAKE